MKVFLYITLLSLIYSNHHVYPTYRNEKSLPINGVCAINTSKYAYKGTGQILTMDSLIINQTLCEAGKFCAETEEGYQCIEKIEKLKADANCKFDEECYSNYCNEGKCTYFIDDAKEDHKNSCTTGKYYIVDDTGKKLCNYYKTENAICKKLGECQPLFECSSNKVCTKKGTLAKGTDVLLPENSETDFFDIKIEGNDDQYSIFSDDLCQSSYAVNSSSLVKCIDVSEVTKCDSSLKCKASIEGVLDGKKTVSMDCAFNTDVTFCPVHEGRKNALKNYVDKLAKVDYEAKRKNETAFFAPGYGEIDVAEAKLIYENFANFVNLRIIDEETLEALGKKKVIINFLTENNFSSSKYLVISIVNVLVLIFLFL